MVTQTTQPDPAATWWTTTDVAEYLGVQVGTVSSYRIRGQMPEPDETEGRTHKWRPSRIIAWHGGRPRPGIGGRTGDDSTDVLSDFLEVSTATETREAAVELARIAVEARLAAGAQIMGPVISAFWHLGNFGTGEEWRLVLRTHVSRFEQLRSKLVENHPWKNPEIVAVGIVAGSTEYLEWVRKTTDPGNSAD